jgi:hypothetical protein
MSVSPHPPLPRRIVLKIKRIIRELDLELSEPDWPKIWPMIESIEGWLYPSQARWLFETARALPDGANIVEIGSYKGRSTCSLGFGCWKTKKQVFAIDGFDGGPDLPLADSYADFRRNVDRCRLSKYIKPIVSSSLQAAQNWNNPIHLLFVDGSHKYEDVVADFAAFFPHVVSNGIVACHDVNPDWPGVLRAWDEVIRNGLTSLGDCDSLAYGSKP